NASNEWLVIGSNLWQIGTPTTPLLSTSNATGYVTRPTTNYTDDTSSYLVSPCYDLTSITNPIVKFNMAFDIEEDWDVLYFEFSTDEGDNWTVLGTPSDPNWYNNSYTAHDLTIGSQWSGTDATFKEYSHTLNEVANESNVIFRFAFLTDALENGEGAIIDDFVIEAGVAGIEDELIEALTIFPNPSRGQFTLQRASTNNMRITVIDITGKKVFIDENIQDETYVFDLAHLEKGIYFAVILEGNKRLTKKLILN
ncbi:MAG: T9SS type A sorting domain-containing protein, partial [Flavobacteriaceae bacterium]